MTDRVSIGTTHYVLIDGRDCWLYNSITGGFVGVYASVAQAELRVHEILTAVRR